jgi:hypothetical protein
VGSVAGRHNLHLGQAVVVGAGVVGVCEEVLPRLSLHLGNGSGSGKTLLTNSGSGAARCRC